MGVLDRVAVVALAAYGRRELTPRTEVDLLFLHQGDLSAGWVAETVCYPLWEHNIRVEPSVRTLTECAADAHRSWSAATSFLDARLIVGDAHLFEDFDRQVTQAWRHDRNRLQHRLRTDAQRRHATHASAAASATPDLVAGRGGLLDIQALRWLADAQDARLSAALDFLLHTLATIEDLVGHTPHRLSARLQQRLAPGGEAAFVADLYRHARWVGFRLDGALAPARDDRALGLGLSLRHGELTAERLPPLDRAPHLGLRIANLVGLAPPDHTLLGWASKPGPHLVWDETTLNQFWLLLRAADWRAWDFLDVTDLISRYVPELDGIRHKAGDDFAVDTHSFLALRRLHEWTESGDPLAERALRSLRRRDWLHASVLLHELSPEAALAAATRLGLPDEASAALAFVVANYRLLSDTATRRDLYDEDLLLDLATRIGTRPRLSLLFLVAVAHDLASGPSAWTAWKADLMRQLFGRLETALRHSGEVGLRRSRSVEHHRSRIAQELERRSISDLTSVVARLPVRYVLGRSPAFIARHLSLLANAPLAEGEVRMQAHRHRQAGLWDLQLIARDRPGLLATMTGVLALRGLSVLAADAATTADGLALDVFTVAAAYAEPLERERFVEIAADVRAALNGRLPLPDLLGARPLPDEEAEAIHVSVDNTASQFFSVVEVRAPDQVGLLYRITAGLHDLGLDIHHAKIATHPDGALDVFYVWDLSGEKLSEPAAQQAAENLAALLRGRIQ